MYDANSILQGNSLFLKKQEKHGNTTMAHHRPSLPQPLL